MSSNTSLRCTTWPGVTAMLPPTVNGRLSTVDGMPPLRRRSRARWRAPAMRLRPRVSTALASALGLPSSVLVGAAASVIRDRAKPGGAQRLAQRDTGFDREALGQAGEGGADLAPAQADERVGAEDGRVVGVEEGGGLRCHGRTVRNRGASGRWAAGPNFGARFVL